MKPFTIIIIIIACLCVLTGDGWYQLRQYHNDSHAEFCVLDKVLVDQLLPDRAQPVVLANINAIIAQAPCAIAIQDPPKKR